MPIHTRTSMPSRLPAAADVRARAHAENFPVASLVFGRRVRSHLSAIYGFARLADEIGDSIEGDRLEALDWLEDELDRCPRGGATHPLLRQLSETIRVRGLPLEPFRRLIEANRRDQVVKRCETFEDLVAYCDLSAAPVGRLVLGVFGADTEERIELSDRVCAGLQVAEHIQDVSEDAFAGRIYLPLKDLRRFGCAESDLLARSASDPLRGVIALQVARARHLLDAGLPLARSLAPRARLPVCGFVAGGQAALDAVCRANYDVLAVVARPGRVQVASRLVRTFTRGSV